VSFRNICRGLAPMVLAVTSCALPVGILFAILFRPRDVRTQATVAALTRRPLLTATIEGGKTVTSVQSAQIDFSPAQATGVHSHPIPVVGQVTRGAFQFQVEGAPSRILTAGNAFYEPANTRILHFDNVSDRETASIVAFYLMGKADSELIRRTPTGRH
jgi:quercetin dioxygenase-like cupin family protein